MARIFRVGSKVKGATYVGYIIKEYPLREGNEFSLQCPNGHTLWVENISLEDFEEICNRKNLYNVEVIEFDHGRCHVIDDRIPRDWFRN